jgi:hypothetical protein
MTRKNWEEVVNEPRAPKMNKRRKMTDEVTTRHEVRATAHELSASQSQPVATSLDSLFNNFTVHKIDIQLSVIPAMALKESTEQEE